MLDILPIFVNKNNYYSQSHTSLFMSSLSELDNLTECSILSDRTKTHIINIACDRHVRSELQNKNPFVFYIQHLCADVLYMEALMFVLSTAPTRTLDVYVHVIKTNMKMEENSL